MDMSRAHELIRYGVSRSALSVALLVCSAAWFVGSYSCYKTIAFKGDWSATPIFWLLILLMTPAICFATCIVLVGAHRHSGFSRFDWSALLAAFFPVTLGTLLAGWVIWSWILRSAL
jgi:hypothetical protein